jgi:ABC-type transport system involved in cytochrome c biogenesis ATPase subunit/GNAT superfamily N-acetyltransferase
MKIDILRECPIVETARVLQVAGMFDVPVAEKSRIEIKGELPIEDRPWNVGLIVGPSGSGKSSLARECFSDAVIAGFDWPEDRAILDGFPAGVSIKTITALLNAVGFGSVPNWLRPFHVLSNGEQFRATVARALIERPEIVVIDEFTSVVDRQVAKVAAHCVQKTVRRGKRQFIAVSCHYDIVEWLQPDWVYEPHLDAFEWRLLQPRPALAIEIRSVGKSVWPQFGKYHYLNNKLHGGAVCIGGFLDGRCIAFSSAVRFPHPNAKNLYQEHRTVVLPEFQGLGLGGALADWLGLALWQHGWRLVATIAHPAVIAHKNRSPRWQWKRSGFGAGGGERGERKKHQDLFSMRRVSTSFEYTAPKGTPASRVPMPLDELRAA